MRHRHPISPFRPLLAALFASAMVLTPLVGIGPSSSRVAAASPVYLTTYVNGFNTFVRNFNPFISGSRLDFTQGAIYEPLMIFTTAGKGHTYPWLATHYKWLNGGKAVLVTIRSGVKWSDGKPFTPADVVFTFNYGKKYSVADETGLMQSGQITKVFQVGSNQVQFNFSTVNSTVLPQLLSTNVMIVPQHIWSKITNPGTWTNPTPVGTGPFARVASFSSQEFILGKNPYYWQKLSYDGIRVPALSGNAATLAAAVSGELDWTANLFSNVQQSYVAHDPTHFHAYYGNAAYTLGLYVNDEKYPFSLYALREAISLALDRNKISTIAESGYEPVSDALGISRLYPTWVDPKLTSRAKSLATYNPAKSKQILTSAGFTYKGSNLYDPKGNRVSLNLTTPNDWNDWVEAMTIVQNNLRDIGIDANYVGVDDNTYFDKRGKRLFDGLFFSPLGGVSVYGNFERYMSRASYFPVGQDALATGMANLSGWTNAQADSLLKQFRQTTNHKTQLAIMYKLEKIQLDNLPYVPTVYAPYWYTYSTRHFTGFPNKQNNYANGSTYAYPDNVKIMTTIKPVK